MSEEKTEERKSFGTFGNILVAMAVLAVAGIFMCVIGYETIGTMMVRVAIVVDVGAAMVMGLKWVREKRGEDD